MNIKNQNKPSPAFLDLIDKLLVKEPEEKILVSKLWMLVKDLEESSEEPKQQLNEIVATLLVNFGPDNKGRHKVLIERDDKPFTMLIKVLEYYVTDNQKLNGASQEMHHSTTNAC